MTSRTEERLRDATRALARQVRPQDIPQLRIPEAPARSWRATGRWTGGRWLIPVAAAAAVLALIITLTVIGQALPRPRPPAGPDHGMPAYLITSLDGQGYVQSTATGRVVARIRPPVPGFLIEAIAVQPGERAFYLAGNTPATPHALNLEVFKFTLDASGRPGRPHRLGTPVIERLPRMAGRPTTIPMAISPDGKELAWAWQYQLLLGYVPRPASIAPATITVQDVATGDRRTWSIWPALGTGINSLSFAGDNRVGFVAMIVNAAVSGGSVVPRRDNQLRVFMVLNLSAPGSGLVADSRLVTYSSQPGPPGTTGPQTGPSDGLISPDGRSAYLTLGAADFTSRLVRMSVGTGKVTSVLEREPVEASSDAINIDGNQMLISLPPLHSATSSRSANINLCAYLAGVNLSTGRISRLPAPSSCPEITVFDLFGVAW